MTVDMHIFSKDIIAELKELGYIIRHQDDLVMAKTTDKVKVHRLPATSEHGALDLKGLIMTETETESGLELVAPGCPVPLDEPLTDTKPQSYIQALDGIMYRFYYYQGEWEYSTTGCITPTTSWGPKGTPTFTELMDDAVASGLVVYEDLSPDQCYYAILQHPKFTNMVKHEEIKLTYMYSITINTELKVLHADTGDYGFKSYPTYSQEPPACNDNMDPHPLTARDMGYVMLYRDGSTYRYEPPSFKRANEIRPNLADPMKQWVNLMNTGDTKLVQEYVAWFPHYAEQFKQLDDRFTCLLNTIVQNYKDIDQDGWSNTIIPARNVSYMRDLLDEVRLSSRTTPSDDLVAEIRTHLLNEDPKRIFFLLNPYDVAPKQRAASAGVVNSNELTI